MLAGFSPIVYGKSGDAWQQSNNSHMVFKAAFLAYKPLVTKTREHAFVFLMVFKAAFLVYKPFR
jgi:hypothetical protein